MKFVKKGLLRRYTLVDGKEITLEFAAENAFLASLYAIVTKHASLDTIDIGDTD